MLVVYYSKNFKKVLEMVVFLGLIFKECVLGIFKGKIILSKVGLLYFWVLLFLFLVKVISCNFDIKVYYNCLFEWGKIKM